MAVFMHYRKVIVMSFLLVCWSLALGEVRTPGKHTNAQGDLTVTAVVVCSATLVWNEKGIPQTLLANCPGLSDDVFHLNMISLSYVHKEQLDNKRAQPTKITKPTAPQEAHPQTSLIQFHACVSGCDYAVRYGPSG